MKNFTPWVLWEKMKKDPDGINCPGIYLITFDKKVLNKAADPTQSEIVYVGMTNSKGGIKSRLKQFVCAVRGTKVHSGGSRVRYQIKRNKNFEFYKKQEELLKNLHISFCAFKCNVKLVSPETLRVMGEVAKHEYYVLSDYLEKNKCLPRFNDRKLSPRKD